MRQRELETELYVQWCQISGFATARDLHVIPFEEWLVKQAIDGDSQADELLGLRLAPQEARCTCLIGHPDYCLVHAAEPQTKELSQ